MYTKGALSVKICEEKSMKKESAGKNLNILSNYRRLSPGLIIILGFALIILVGATLLCLPISSVSGTFTDYLDCMFTAVSATCVTGLTVVDTLSHWSEFGQGVILTLIQIGGLGFMTMAMMLSLLVRRRVSPRERLILSQSFSGDGGGNALPMMKKIVKRTFLFEGIGALLLLCRFCTYDSFPTAIKKSVFHSVSAFCNAGFDVLGVSSEGKSSMAVMDEDPMILLTITALIVMGGVGFLVWDEVGQLVARKRRKLSVYSRFVLIITAALLIGGTALTLLFEWNNPATLGSHGIGDKLTMSLFHSATLRTAGFAVFDCGSMMGATVMISIVLMLIGGSSGSTAGGVKTGTFGLVIYAAFCVAAGRDDVVLMRRKVDVQDILRAVSLIVICILLVFSFAVIILQIEQSFSVEENAKVNFISIFFEAASAFSTCGLTMGITSSLTGASHILLMILMFLGRIGIFTVTVTAFAKSAEDASSVKFPTTKMLVG